MNSLCEIIALTISPFDRQNGPHGGKGDFARHCRALLEEARALGLDLDDVIDALRRSAAPFDQSN